MRTVAEMIIAHGGLDRLIEKPIRVPASDPWMRLCLENVGVGPRGLPLISVAHYYEHAGDLLCDPDMTFEVGPGGEWSPVSIQHATGAYFVAVWRAEDGRTLVRPALVQDLKSFARVWDRNLGRQGYADRFKKIAC